MSLTNHRISFCMTAMNRLDHVKQTLFRNIIENDDYPTAQFVLLDYGSRDGLGHWIQENAMGFIESSKLVYLRLEDVTYYSMAHSRNVCFLAADGPVLCNVNADNFLPRGFAGHLNELMSRDPLCNSQLWSCAFEFEGTFGHVSRRLSPCRRI